MGLTHPRVGIIHTHTIFNQVSVHLSFFSKSIHALRLQFPHQQRRPPFPHRRQPIIDKLSDCIASNSIKREVHRTQAEWSDQKYICLKQPSLVYSWVLQSGKQYNTYYKFHFIPSGSVCVFTCKPCLAL